MKTVRMVRDFTYRPKRNVHIQYVGGATYERVPEAAVRAIISARAGDIVENEE